VSDWKAQMNALVESRYDDLVAHARMVSRSSSDAEDLVLEALVATFGRPRNFDSIVLAETHVRRAIVTKSVDAGRRRGRDRGPASQLSLEARPSHDSGVIDRTDLQRALATLPPRERACVVLRYLEHLSVRETASVLGIAEGSVKRYVSDGITRLNDLLGTEDMAGDVTVTVLDPRGGRR
jgi:RNA polymerase sigma factor (sigma-70 family)